MFKQQEEENKLSFDNILQKRKKKMLENDDKIVTYT